MKRHTNVGSIDRVVRIALGIALIAAAATGTITGVALSIGLLVAAIAVVTGVVGFCPLYYVLGISTSRNRFAVKR
jgi:Protein of unknown function (DUF2892)